MLRRLSEETDTSGEVWGIVRNSLFTSRQEALEAAADDEPRAGDDREPRMYVAIPGSYFKPATVRVERVESVKWEDA